MSIKKIQIIFEYPSEEEDDIVNGMLYDPKTDGESKPEFILHKAQSLLVGWVTGSINHGKRLRGIDIPIPKPEVKPDKGFGDTLARWIDWIVIKPLTSFLNAVHSGTCGCNKRRQWLNKVFSYKQTKQ